MPKPLPQIYAPISLGELIDKITILEIKAKRLGGSALNNVCNEMTSLQATFDALDLEVDQALIKGLKDVNACLWQIEEDLRAKERSADFGEDFIRLARAVYQQNDRRADLKKEINLAYGSVLVEEKSYLMNGSCAD